VLKIKLATIKTARTISAVCDKFVTGESVKKQKSHLRTRAVTMLTAPRNVIGIVATQIPFIRFFMY